MRSFFVFAFFTVYFVSPVTAQKKTIVYPFEELLNGTDTLIVRGGPLIIKTETADTVFKPGIERIRSMYFTNKDFSVEQYGLAPSGSIELMRSGKQIALIRCWEINDTYYAVDVSIDGNFSYRGLLIRKPAFDRAFAHRNKTTQ